MVKSEIIDRANGLKPSILNVTSPTNLDDAKAYLMQSDADGNNLFEHLTDVILHLLEHHPEDPFKVLEQVSIDVKSAKLTPPDQSSGLKEVEEPTFDLKLATQRSLLLKGLDGNLEGEENPTLPNEGDIPDVIEEAAMFEWAGVGLGREETVRLAMNLKRLLESEPLRSVRFFGKVFGRKRDYLVAETEFKDGEGDLDVEEPKKVVQPKKARDDSDSESEAEAEVPPPKVQAPQQPQIESESRTGTNKYTYWVLSEDEAWVRLPDVTPAQLSVARKITKYLSGDLDAKVESFPPFPGTEKNLLRAQIARIVASTSISPKGFYSLEDEDSDALELNQDFEGLDPADLLQANNWVHHHPHILQQGRCTFFKVSNSKDEDEEEDEEDEEDTSPRLLTDLSEDDTLGKHEAWSTKLSSSISSKYAHVIVRSNRWPGAFAFAKDDRYANLYVGFGLKFNESPYAPSLPTNFQTESSNPTESSDPTAEEEQEGKKDNQEKEDGETEVDDEDEDSGSDDY